MKHFNWSLGIVALLVLAVLVVPAIGAEAKGKIKSVNAEKNEFVLTADGKDIKCEMKEDAKIRLNDKEGRFRDLKAGDEVAITYQVQGERNLVSEIRCTRKE
jgi:hypothetical protein